MTTKLPTRTRLQLFVKRVMELQSRPWVQSGMNSGLTISWSASTQLLTQQTREPDEEELRSFLLSFRHFVSKDEPVFLPRVLNDCVRFLADDKMIGELKKAQDHWKQVVNKFGAFQLVINDQKITGEHVLDLWINGEYFHNDADKAAELRQHAVGNAMPLVRTQFLSVLSLLMQIVLYVGNVVAYCLQQDLFKIPDDVA